MINTKQNFSNLTDQDLRSEISKKEELLQQIENKFGKTREEFRQLARIKEELQILLKQSVIPFRLINTIWINRLDSIFFSIKTVPSEMNLRIPSNAHDRDGQIIKQLTKQTI